MSKQHSFTATKQYVSSEKVSENQHAKQFEKSDRKHEQKQAGDSRKK